MGMYTEVIFGASLKENTPEDIIQIIQDLINDNHLERYKDIHPFFACSRNWLLCSGGSAYFPGVVMPQFNKADYSNQWTLHFRTNIKNYDEEIEKFLSWIKPYIEDGSGDREFYAIVMYEEFAEPTIYYLHD